MLEPHHPSRIPNRTSTPPPPVQVEGDLEWEIERIVDSKIDKRYRCRLLYLVTWLGYEGTDDQMSWLPVTELDHAQDLIRDFHIAYPNKPGPLSALVDHL